MAPTNSETTFTADDMQVMRAQVRAIADTEGLSQAAMARESGIAPATFALWLSGKYEGNNDRVAREVEIWLAARVEKKRAASTIQRAPEFQVTPSAKAFLELLSFAQFMPEISVIGGAPGIGKTTTIQYYAANNPNVWLATMQPCASTVYPMLGELAAVMQIDERVQTKLSRAIGRKMADRGGLIVIDEAQHLDARALDQLRSLYDLYGVGIALVGNETIYSRLDNEGRKANFAQLVSRIGMRITQAKPKAADMCALIAAWDVTDSHEVRLLKALASKPGALRNITKIMQVASMLAAGEGVPRTIEHIKRAARQLGFEPARAPA